MTSGMAWTTDRLRIVIHHLAKRLHAGSQAKQLEARRNVRQSLKLQRSRRDGSGCGKLIHGVAFLCGISTPSLSARGEQRRPSYFNIERDNSIDHLNDGGVLSLSIGLRLWIGHTRVGELRRL